MADWLWHRTVTKYSGPGRSGTPTEVRQERTTPGMTPPPGKGWTLVPGQIPAGRVEGGTGPTKRQASKPPKTRVGEYDSNGIGKITSEAKNDTGGRRPRRATTKYSGVKPGQSAVQKAARAES